MNTLARVVHDLVTGHAKISADLLAELSQEEQTALQELISWLEQSPAKLAEWGQEPPSIDWQSPLTLPHRDVSEQ